MNDDRSVLIVGAGIAGACVAWFAHQAGFQVRIVDAGSSYRASTVPTALINPVRGKQGYFVKQGDVAARASFALITQLIDMGYPVAHGKGVWRPVPDEPTYLKWCATLPADYPHQWHRPIPADLGMQDSWYAALYLPEAGWVNPAELITALLTASQATVIAGTVQHIVPTLSAASPPKQVALANGDILEADHLVWCGGALGAHILGQSLGIKARYQPGQVITVSPAICQQTVSYGLFAAPWQHQHTMGNCIGPTTEYASDSFLTALDSHIAVASTSSPSHRAETNTAIASNPPLQALRKRAVTLFSAADETTLHAANHWHGVRLAQAHLPTGLWHLTALGSKGFLLAPLLAHALIQQLMAC